ncbi:hypothetical protein O7635_29810 [Asanoa sp. WMMD1127]|uniref:hypothetical protein n=1 Tax=Asanoa sp. WMMD1127 TaxID=3016107 RepID=UPI0024167D76|nr:hypothetical protein [Asanoa sp. WMMD1127]MDG4826065.1 hypothetical protein [Asanoa sp. WMMD1127]
MSNLEDLERRIAAIEDRLGVESGLRASGGDRAALEHRGEGAPGPPGGGRVEGRGRDLADMAQTLRAQQHTIQALAIAQSQHNEKLDRHEDSLTAAHGRLDRVIAMLDRLLDPDGR